MCTVGNVKLKFTEETAAMQFLGCAGRVKHLCEVMAVLGSFLLGKAKSKEPYLKG